jgi:hypothetical protein
MSWIMYAVTTIESIIDRREQLVHAAETYVEGFGGDLGEEFVDLVEDTPVSWVRRPQANRRLAYVSDPRCASRHVVAPNPSEAFTTEDLRTAAVLLEHHGIELHLAGTGAFRGRGLSTRAASRALRSAGDPSPCTIQGHAHRAPLANRCASAVRENSMKPL